jgi:hypothetical protein
MMICPVACAPAHVRACKQRAWSNDKCLPELSRPDERESLKRGMTRTRSRVALVDHGADLANRLAAEGINHQPDGTHTRVHTCAFARSTSSRTCPRELQVHSRRLCGHERSASTCSVVQRKTSCETSGSREPRSSWGVGRPFGVVSA